MKTTLLRERPNQFVPLAERVARQVGDDLRLRGLTPEVEAMTVTVENVIFMPTPEGWQWDDGAYEDGDLGISGDSRNVELIADKIEQVVIRKRPN